MADAPSRWPQFARVLRRQALMDDMMEAQGVDLVAAVRAGEGFVEARANAANAKMRQRAGPGSSSSAESRRNSVPTGSSSPRSRARGEGQS
jgi:hypothetical protein